MTIGFLTHPVIPYSTVEMYRRVNRVEDEERLLEEMLILQSQIRDQREGKRISRTNNTERYSKMFKPVTGAIEKLTPQVPPPVADLLKLDGGDDVGDEAMTLKTEEEQREEIQLDEPGAVYKQALADVPVRFRDDGLLGLDTTNHRIGDYVYSVDGDTLKVHE